MVGRGCLFILFISFGFLVRTGVVENECGERKLCTSRVGPAVGEEESKKIPGTGRYQYKLDRKDGLARRPPPWVCAEPGSNSYRRRLNLSTVGHTSKRE